MSTRTVHDTVLQVSSSVLKQPVSLASTRENTPGWDSLKQVELIFAIEDELGIQFDESEIEQLTGVQAIIELALGRHAA